MTNGTLTGIYISARRGENKTPVEQAELIPDHGVRGDSHAGLDARRQVSLFSVETIRKLLAEGFAVSPEQISANLFTESIELDSLKPHTRLRIGETELEIVERRTPCRSIARIDNRLPKRLYSQCGQLARIIKGGAVQPGDTVEILTQQSQPVLF